MLADIARLLTDYDRLGRFAARFGFLIMCFVLFRWAFNTCARGSFRDIFLLIIFFDFADGDRDFEECRDFLMTMCFSRCMSGEASRFLLNLPMRYFSLLDL